MSHEFLVVWNDKEIDGGQVDLFAQRLSEQGTLLGGRVEVVRSFGWTFWPDINVTPDGSYLLTWMDDPNAFDIAARVMSSDLRMLGEAFTVFSSGIHDLDPDTTYSPALDAYLVTWVHHFHEETPAKVMGRWVLREGAVLGEPFTLGIPPADFASRPSVRYDPATGQMLVAWSDNRTGEWRPYGQLVGPDGPLNQPVLLSTDAVVQSDVPAGPLLANNGLVVWISGQRTSVVGAMFQPIMADFTATPAAGAAPLTVNFVDHSAPASAIISWSWDFGDGTTDTAASPAHTYTQTGAYTVTLTTEGAGQRQTMHKPEVVHVGTYAIALEATPLAVVADGSSASVVSVALTTSGGLPVENQSIELRSTPDTGVAINGQPALGYVVLGSTDSSGVLTATVTSSSSGVRVLDARIVGGDSVAQPLSVTFTAGPADADASQLDLVPSTVVADGSAAGHVIARLYDHLGNPVPGKELRIQTIGSGIELTQPITRTDRLGRVQAMIRSTVAQNVIVTAIDVTDGLPLTQQRLLTFSADAASAARSDIDVTPRTVAADLTQTATISATIRDAQDNPLANRLIHLNVTGSDNTITPATEQLADGDGHVVFQLASSRIEAKQLTLVDVTSGVALDAGQVTFVAGVVSPTRSTLSASPPRVAADGSSAASVAVVLLDAADNPVRGIDVTLTTTATDVIFTQPTAPSDANGRVSGSLVSSAAQPVIIHAETGGQPLNEQAQVRFVGHDIAVSQTGPGQAGLDTDITYHVALRNNDLMAADTIVVTDTLPPGATYLASTAAVSPTVDGQTLVWAFLDPLAYNGSFVFDVCVHVADDEALLGTTLSNGVAVAARGTDEHPTNNSAIQQTILAGVDLVAGLSALANSNEGLSQRLAASGFPISYTLTLHNGGPTAARNVVLTDTLPSQLSGITQDSSFPFSIANGLAVWQIGRLEPDQTVSIALVGQIDPQFAGAMTNRIVARTSNAEDALQNNQARQTTTVEQPAPRLAISPSSPVMAVGQGASASLVATVRNTGLAALGGFAAAPPPYEPWVSVDAGDLAMLLPGQSTTLTITAAPANTQTPGYYRGLVVLSGDSAPTWVIALTVQVQAPTHPLAVIVENNQGAQVAGATVMLTKQDASVIVTQGVTNTYHVSAQGATNSSGVASLSSVEPGAYAYTLDAADHEPASGQLTIVAGSGTQTETLQMIGLPRLVVEPTTPVLTVLPGQHVAKEIQIRNAGAAPLTNVTIAPPASIPWISLGTPGAIPSIGMGESVSFTVFASPPDPLTGDIFQGYLTVSADGGRTAQAALTVHIAPVTPQTIQLQVVDGGDRPITTTGTITLIRQELTVQITEGVTTTFNQQFSLPFDGAGVAQFAGLPPGDYNYLVFADGYEQGAATLTVEPRLPSDPVQVVKTAVRADPFRYRWDVTPIQQGYDISLVLTYDIDSPAPGVLIPARYWKFFDCDQQLDDLITIYNPTDIPLDLNNLALSVPGVNVVVGAHPSEIRPHESVQVPVRATQVGPVGKGVALATFNYQAAADPYVTYTVNPSSQTSVVTPGAVFSTTFALEPVIFNQGAQYLLQVSQPVSMTGVTVEAGQTDPITWTDSTSIPITLTADLQAPLENGVYVDRAPVQVVGTDGTHREGALVITITKTDQGMQLHTSFELGPIPMVIQAGAGGGNIHPSLDSCDGGETSGSSGGGWVWGWAPGGGGLVGHPGSGGGGMTAPSFPKYVPPPIYGNAHQQVRILIPQRVMMEGEGFRATLRIDNTSASPLDVVSVALRITDVLSGELQNSSFIITPTIPTDLGRVDVGGSTSREWLLLPSGLDLRSQAGQQFNVKAIITYTWQGGVYSLETEPEQITVLPAPDLEITYELPLETVPCNVFFLKAIFENHGAGAARNLRFTSAQPHLLDAENSLPIDFTITRAFVDGVDKGPTLALNLGDLSPGGRTTVLFELHASRPGKFVEFTSDYRQANYQGMLLRPLISKINTRFVREGTICSGHRARINPIAGDSVPDSGVDANAVQQVQHFVGGPINVDSGNYVYSVQDLGFMARGGPLNLRRIYSRDRLAWSEDNILGPGWTHNYNIHLYFNNVNDDGDAQEIVLQQSNGSRQAFQRSSSGGYEPREADGLIASLTRTPVASGSHVYSYTVILHDQTRYQFDNDGLLRQIDKVTGDGFGPWNPLTLDYITRTVTITPTSSITATAHLLTRISDGTGAGARSLTFRYNDPRHGGQISEIFDQRGGSGPASRRCASAMTPTATW